MVIVSISLFADPIILKAADDHAEGYPTVEALKFMGKIIEIMTNGKYKIEVYPSAQLGSEKETIEQTILGAIDIDRVSVSPLVAFYPPIGVLTLPYVFRDQDHMWKVLEGPIGEELLKGLEKVGLVGLCYYDAGARSFYTVKKPILKPEDLKGLKIRVQKNPVMIELMKTLGASPVPMAFEEVYTALQTGVIDGAENNPPSYYETRHFEVAPYYSLDGHTRIPEVVLVSKVLWDKLTDEEKLIFKTAALASAEYEKYLWNQWEEMALKKVQEGGAKIFHPDVTLFQKAVQPLYDRYPAYKEFLERIQAVK
ncbi:TRAP dicarboxylate transporter, DctP subunit [Thermotoga petrophila RKU-10]|uniref:TRAP dicarboxylate transporter, DctP subunit n=1 Tax=Thermotoga petrophila (strain ATCC BAA-489 / DSM 13996 / JCM 10882 / RKU-10) TaxID=590168 RepID=D2C5T6_THEP2|nr:TRAP dicarboxylate transporter, DctP subunit [Thermotoga petrophila RKU-10]